MKLQRLRIAQLRRFRTPLELHFTDGLNLIVGPNEAGKSTVVRAIRAAFLERHTTTSVEDLRPWGDSGATPEVELDFEWQGQTWRLAKRFLGRKRCDLSVGQQRYSGEDAEDRLAQLLGYQYPGRGSTRAELWGVPGLLWVEQGTGHTLEQPVQYAAAHLQAALGRELDAMTSSAGDAILARVTALRDELLTTRGQPRGTYKAAVEALQALTEDCAKLEDAVQTYQRDVDELARLSAEQQQDERDRVLPRLQAELQATRDRLAEVQQLRRDAETLRQQCEATEREQQLVAQQLDTLQHCEQALQQLQQDQATERACHDLATAERNALQAQLHAARTARDAAQALRERLLRQQQRRDIIQQLDDAQRHLQRLHTDGTDAQRASETLLAVQTRLQQQRLDHTTLAELQRLQQKVRELDIRLGSVATRVHYRFDDGVQIDWGGETVSGRGERLLTHAQTLTLPGLGELTIEPGGRDLKALAQTLQDAQAELNAQLRAHGVASLDEAQQRAEQTRQWRAEAQQAQALLQRLAPEGLDALQRQTHLAQTRVAQLHAQLQALPADDQPLPDAAAVQTQLNDAQARVQQLEASDRALAEQIATCVVHLQHLAAEQTRIEAQRAQLHRLGDRAQLGQRLSELTQAATQQRQQLDALLGRIAQAQPEVLEQDEVRLRRSLEAQQRRHDERRQRIATLHGALQQAGAQGLEEQWQQRCAERTQAEQRCGELRLRALALQLLVDKLSQRRDALKRRLQAPLTERVQHYLRVLFVQAQVRIDDALLPQRLQRGDEQAEVAALSFGAREQLGLISRLAYADLLQAAGHPTLIILDDALVHSDRQRLAQMKRMLYDAAQRHQILLLSCHPEDWVDLGVAPLELPAAG